MNRSQQPAVSLFAVGMIGLGVLALVYGDFAMGWQPVASWVPGRTALAYGSGVFMLLAGTGLMLRLTGRWASWILFPYLVAWALLKVPAIVVAPRMEAVYLGLGELTALLAGGWTLFARLADINELSPLGFLAGDRGVRAARILFGISLLPIGLSHLVYSDITAHMVPAWLPWHMGWAVLTGVGQMACGAGILLRIFPRVAAWTETAMIASFTLLLWLPAVVAAPRTRLPWTAFWISWAIAAAAAVVAQNTERNSLALRDRAVQTNQHQT